jgi:hypothetical protein
VLSCGGGLFVVSRCFLLYDRCWLFMVDRGGLFVSDRCGFNCGHRLGDRLLKLGGGLFIVGRFFDLLDLMDWLGLGLRHLLVVLHGRNHLHFLGVSHA